MAATLAGAVGLAQGAATSGTGDEDAPPSLRFLDSAPVHDRASGLTEPSGLAFDDASGVFWVVSDDSEWLYRLDAGGTKNGAGPRIGGLEDAEGIALDRARNRLLVLSESAAAILAIGLDASPTVSVHRISGMDGRARLAPHLDAGAPALSPEGLTVDPSTGRVFVVNEDSPRLLIEITPNLAEIAAVTPLSAAAGFAVPGVEDSRLDASGIAFDAARGAFWITSDVGRSVFLWNGRSPALRFELRWTHHGKSHTVHNAEGVALAPDGRGLRIVSDDGKDSRFFAYALD